MADEGGLQYIIGVAVDNEGVGAQLEDVVANADRMVSRVNSLLEGLGAVNSFEGLVASAEKGRVSIDSLVESAQVAKLSISEAADAVAQLNSLGIGAKVTGVEDIQKLIAQSEKYLAIQRELAASTGAPTLRTTTSGRTQSTETGRLVSAADAQATVAAFEQEANALKVANVELTEQIGSLRQVLALNEEIVAAQREGRASGAAFSAATRAAENLPPPGPARGAYASLSDREKAEFARDSGHYGAPGSQDEADIQAQYGAEGRLQYVASDPTLAAARVAELRAQQASNNLDNVQDPNKLPGAQASYIASLANQQKTAEALARQGELQEHFNALQAAGIELTKVELAQMKLLTAELALAEASEKGVNPATALGNRLQTNVVSQQAALAKAQADAAGGSGGFLGGFRTGLAGGSSGGGAEELGNQIAQVAKYTALYQGFRLIEESIKNSISEMLDFERGVTNLSVQLGISRDNARSLATNLGNIASANGLAPSQGAALGGQFAGVFAGQGSATDLATQGATVGSQLAVVSGAKDAGKNLSDTTATLKAFNLGADDTSRVLDAATTAAEHFLGSIDPSKVLPGLAQIGDLAQQAGISLEQTANLLADVQSRTGDTSEAAAGELRRVLGREAQPAFQQVFAQVGINTTLPFQQELQQLSERYDTLSDKQKAYIANQFGGARAGAAAVAVIEDYAKVQDAANQSLQEGGAFQQAYGAKLNDIKGIITSIEGEFKNLAKDFGETGVFAGLGVALELLKPGVQTLDDFLQLFNKIPAPIRDTVAAVIELGIALKVLSNFGGIGGIVGRIPGAARLPGAGALGITGPAAAEGEGAAVGAAKGVAAIDAAALEIATAMKEAAGTIAAGGAEIGAAETEVATVVVAGGAEIAAAEASTAARSAINPAGAAAVDILPAEAAAGGALAGLKSGAAGLLNAIGPLGVAIGGIIAIDQTLKDTRAQIKSVREADSLQVTGQTSEDLKDAASKLNSAATKAEQSSAGPLGSTTNFIRSNLGNLADAAAALPGGAVLTGAAHAFGLGNGEDTATAAARAKREAALATFEAQALDKAQAASATTGNDAASQLDLSSTGGITNGLKNLALSGHDATQQLDALHERLTNFAEAAAGGADVLAKGESVIIAQQIANSATNKLNTYAQIDVDANNPNKGAASRFLKQDQQGINALLATTANDYFKSIGVDQGGAISASQQKELAAREVQALKDNLAKSNLSKDEIRSLTDDINLAVQTSIKQRIADANAVAGQVLTPEQAQQVLADAPALIQQEQATVGTQASLSGAASGGAKAGADAALARAQQLYGDLIKSGVDPQSLLPLKEQIDQLTLAAQQATVAHLAAMGQLAESLISPFDSDGQIAAKLSTLQSELAVTTDADAKAALQSQINQLKFQQAQQQVDDANSALAVGIASNDADGKALVAYQQAVNNYNLIVSEGVTSGAKFNQAAQAVNDARQAAIDAQVAQINDQSTSTIDPRQTQVLDQNALDKINTQLANTNQYGSDGKQTSAYSNLLTQQHQAQLKVLADSVAEGTAIQKANSDSTNPLQQLQIQLESVIRNYNTVDLGDPTKQANDVAQAKALNVAIIQRTIDEANAIQNAARDPRNIIQADQQQVQQDKVQIANDGGDAKKRADDEAKLKADRAKEAQDLVAQANAQRDAGVRAGDPLAAAQAALSDANSNLALDLKGQGLYFQHLAAVHAAEAALSQAIADHAKTEALLAGDTTDPVAQALADLKSAQVKLAEDKAKKTGDLDADQLAVETAAQAAQKAQFDQTFALQQTAYSLHEESASQYLNYLKSQDSSIRKQLSGMKKGQEGYQQLVDELNQIDGAIQGLNSQLQGQFNLGDIKLPTVYEVRRSVAATTAGQAIDASSVQNVNVTINGADFQAVVNYMNGILGGRGATATVATTGRKAA